MLLDDFSPMPFGIHKGKDMEKVPASYLIWLGKQMANQKNLSTYQLAVQKYIDDNWEILLNESKSNQ